MEYIYKAPTYNHGNRCGHVVAFPRLYERAEHKAKTYSTIHTALNALPEFYSNCKKYLQELNYNRYHRDKNDQCVIWAMNRQRSELREAVARVAGLLIDCCDYETMEAVVFRNGTREPITLAYIAMFFAMSYKRVYRALRCLRKSGYVELEYRSRYIGNKFVKIVAIKRISQKLFTHLGVSHLKLQEDIHRARTKHERREHGQKQQQSVYDRRNSTPRQACDIIQAKLEATTHIPTIEESVAATKSILAKFKKPPP